jgi:hypothetical protein
MGEIYSEVKSKTSSMAKFMQKLTRSFEILAIQILSKNIEDYNAFKQTAIIAETLIAGLASIRLMSLCITSKDPVIQTLSIT